MTKKESEKTKKDEVQKVEPTRRLSPFEEMDRMFNSLTPRGWIRPLHFDWPAWSEMHAPFEGKIPRVDVIDKDSKVIIRAEVPGLDKKDLEVSMTDNTVTIKGSTSHEEKEEKGDYYRCEISSGSFSRTVALPSDVDNDKAKTKFKHGVLEITVPKVEKSKRRKIEVE